MEFYFRVIKPRQRWLCVKRETIEDAEYYMFHDDEIDTWERISKAQLSKGLEFKPTGAFEVSEGMVEPALNPSPRCDQCLSEMVSERVSTGTIVYECRDCNRSFIPTGGYYNAVGDALDPHNRGSKKCPVNPEEHTFMAVVAREGDSYPWCWYCYDCKAEHQLMVEVE
jgi:ribosomal protein L37AE/L43A